MAAAAAGGSGDGSPTNHNQRFVLITPAGLRAYAERRTLGYLRSHPVGLPGVTIAVHSFTSMARQLIGNHYGGRYALPEVSLLTLQTFLAMRMRDDRETFRKAGETFGSMNQFAAQIVELIGAGVSAADIESMPEAGNRLRALAKLLALVEAEFSRFTLPGANANVVIPWAKDHGTGLHVYLYGFEQMTADELCIAEALANHAECTLMVESECRPDFVDVLAGSVTPTDGPSTLTLPALASACGTVDARQADDETTEVHRVVSAIKSLHDHAEKEGRQFSYGDVLVTARDLSAYRTTLAAEFAYHGIPVNATPVATIADQPFADLLLGLLDDRLYEPEPDPTVLLRVFRSHLLHGRYRIADRDLDLLEDALYSSDPKRVWRRRSGSDALSQTIDRIRTVIDEARPLFAARDDCDDTRTVREVLSGMTRFLVRIGANASWRIVCGEADTDCAQQEREHARERLFEQTRTAWNLVMGEFDALVSYFGDEPFSKLRPTFADNVRSLLLGHTVHDQTKASNAVDVIAFPAPMRPYRHVFVLGAVESQLPAIPHETGLLDDAERRTLASALTDAHHRVEAAALLMPTVESKARREILAFNRVLRYAHSLTFSCPRTVNGVPQSLSPFVAESLSATGNDPIQEHNDRLMPHVRTIDDLDSFAEGEPHAVTLVEQNTVLDPALMLSLFTKPERTDDDTAEHVMNVSVSQIEKFYANPFETFLSQGLKIRPVKPFQLTAAIEGSFRHAVLERVVAVKIAALAHGGKLDDIPSVYRNANVVKSDDELIRLFCDLHFRPEPIADCPLPETTLLEDNEDFAILDSSKRMEAVCNQLGDALTAFARTLRNTQESWQKDLVHEQSPAAANSKTHIRPMFTEKQFGDIRGVQADWPALETHARGSNGEQPVDVAVRIRGKVDRIDTIERENEKGLVVIDYKSSPRSLFGSNKENAGTMVAYGHELQLLTYALAVRESVASQSPIAGMLFLPMNGKKQTVLPGTLKDNTETGTPDLCGTGLHPSREGKLSLNNAGCLVNPWQARNAKTALPTPTLESEAHLNALCAYARHMTVTACELILDGDMPVAPYRLFNGGENGRDGMTYSDYPDVMALDLLDEQAWRLQLPVSMDQLKAEAARLSRAAMADASAAAKQTDGDTGQ
ncbi:PD-(D/E)XK nuclease family protein [Bifidobacterium leontopitheci]|nr:PD-(D/E)XK nuclease family protein [Bifidobacterium leontopitheci]